MMTDMINQTRQALIYSDLAIFMLNSREGILPNDLALYKWLVEKKAAQIKTKVQKTYISVGDVITGESKIEEIIKDEVEIPPFIVVANKSENGFIGDILNQFHQLKHETMHSVEEPIFISAEHGDGLPDLYKAISDFIPENAVENYEDK